jgi:hypothetical protein
VDWSLRGSARKGHVTYSPDEPELRGEGHADLPKPEMSYLGG